MAIPRARGVGRPLVAGSPQERCDLVLDSALQDELCTEASDGAEGIGVPEAAGEDRFDGSLDLDAGAILWSTAWVS